MVLSNTRSPASSITALSMSSTPLPPPHSPTTQQQTTPTPTAQGTNNNHSPSPTRSPSRGRMSTTLADKISAIGAKIAHTLNITPEHEGMVHIDASHPNVGGGGSGATSPGFTRWGARRESSASPGSAHKGGADRDRGRGGGDDEGTLNGKERSLSRGREAFQSSGRGGIGNIRRASLSRDARPESGPDDFSTTRGREPRVDQSSPSAKIFSTGRGGAGNIRSPSRDVGSVPRGQPAVDAVEEEVIKSHLAAEHAGMHSTGRGGIGNITGSRSRSRARDSSIPPAGSGAHTPLHSTGRGGTGNFLSKTVPEGAEEQEHTTAKGGIGNILAGVEHAFHPHRQHMLPSTGGEKGAHEAPGKVEVGNNVRE